MDRSDCNQAPGGSAAPRLTLLVGALPANPEDNAALIRQAFEDAGWQVRSLLLDSLRLGPAGPLAADGTGMLCPLLEADLLWVLGFGQRAAFLDKHQLLQSVEGRVPFVSRPSALLLYHSKYPFPGRPLPFPHPESWASADPAWLLAQAQAGGGRWVLKPPAGSFGAEVGFWASNDPGLPQALQEATAHGRYALLQREISDGPEWRLLVAGDQLLGAYERRPGTGLGGWNLAAGGSAHLTALPRALRAPACALGLALAREGIGYAGLDLRGGQLLEANVINPGGLGTLAALGQPVAPDALVKAALRAAKLTNPA